ncbi:hypothetical protein RNJ44_00383 [Nakaseomyces bracarensis]|uniref:Uncharacterized protein n=1 Tax=Nakaseomyces bracarensis TaxID=273131 RepID=A0ABR4NSE0_9SACH
MRITSLVIFAVLSTLAVSLDLNNKEELHDHVAEYLDTLVSKHGESLLQELDMYKDPSNEDVLKFKKLQYQLEEDSKKTWYVGDGTFNKLDDGLLANMVNKIAAKFPAMTSLWEKKLKGMGLFYYAFPNTNIFEDLE